MWAPAPCCAATNQALSPILAAQPVCWQRPGLTTPSHHHTDSPLSLRKDLRARPEPGWSAGRWPGSGAEIKCQPGGWMAQERLQCQPNRSPGSRLSRATGPERAPGSRDCKRDTSSSRDEEHSAPFPRSPGLCTARPLPRQVIIHQQACTQHLMYPRLLLGWCDRPETDW